MFIIGIHACCQPLSHFLLFITDLFIVFMTDQPKLYAEPLSTLRSSSGLAKVCRIFWRDNCRRDSRMESNEWIQIGNLEASRTCRRNLPVASIVGCAQCVLHFAVCTSLAQ